MRALFAFFILIFAGLMPSISSAEAISENAFQEHRPTAVRFYATWCGKCKLVDARLSDIQGDFLDKINFVVFEMTDKQTQQESAQKAKNLGLEEVYQHYAPATGLLVLVNAEGKEVETLTYEIPTFDMRLALKNLL